jgi:ATP-dependent Clp protease ATP-binding subunit ClpA
MFERCSPATATVFNTAIALATEQGSSVLSPEHIGLALIADREVISALAAHDIDYEALHASVEELVTPYADTRKEGSPLKFAADTHTVLTDSLRSAIAASSLMTPLHLWVGLLLRLTVARAAWMKAGVTVQMAQTAAAASPVPLPDMPLKSEVLTEDGVVVTVRFLRGATGAGLREIAQALQECHGNKDAALLWLLATRPTTLL